MEYIISHSSERFFRATALRYLYTHASLRSYSRISCKPTLLKGISENDMYKSASVKSARDFSNWSPALLTVNYNDGCRSTRCSVVLRRDLGFCVSRQERRNICLSSVVNKIVDERKTKVEKTVEALKGGVKPAEAPKKSLWQRIVEECAHYYHGFKLLGVDIKVATKLYLRMARGKTLTRREHQLLIRTVGDVFRLVPFSVFIFVPLAELTLPLALKLFPNMLPSTFQTKDEKVGKLKSQLKVKLEVAKFLQETLDQMSLQTKGEKSSQSAKEFKEFFTRVRQSGGQPSTQEILKFSKLFKDDLTLDNLPRAHLLALCRMLELHDYGPSSFLSFQLRMTLRQLKTDDKMIQREGIDKLTTWELQQALKARGIRAIGYSETEMKQQMANWLDLSLKQDVPPSLLLLTRAMAITDVSVPNVEQLAAAIKELPESVANQAEATVGEMEGKVDNKVRLEMLKEEEKRIVEEQKERDAMEKEMADTAPTLQDPAAIVNKEGITSRDLPLIGGALDSISKAKRKLLVEKEELQDLKADVAEYQDDLQELQQQKQMAGLKGNQLQESKAARRVHKQINRMIGKMDKFIDKAEMDKVGIEERVSAGEAKREELVSVNELVASMRRLQKTPDNERMKKIEGVLARMDVDQDGNLSMDDIVKVFELLGHETSNITPRQMKEIVEMLRKEEMLQMEEKMRRRK